MTTDVQALRDSGAGLRGPPANLEAEQALLAAIMESNAAYDRVADEVEPEHFSDPLHGHIFDAMRKIIERGGAADFITLKGFFERDGDLAEAGGAAYLTQLAGSVVLQSAVADYGHVIADLWRRRQLIEVGTELVAEAQSGNVDASAHDMIENAESQLYAIAEAKSTTGPAVLSRFAHAFLESAEAAYKQGGRIVGLSTGLRSLDVRVGGLRAGQFVVLAGRPAMGKTALALGISIYNAKDTHRVLFFSHEMPGEELAGRIASADAELSLYRVRSGRVNDDEFNVLLLSGRALDDVALLIDDSPSLTVAAIRSRTRRAKRSGGLALVVVDYMQLVDSGRDAMRFGPVHAMTEVSRGLKAMAKELAVPVLAVSQLSRAVESRDDKRPQLSDLRDSGAIEQDADIVLFVFREEYYVMRREPDPSSSKHMDWEEDLNRVKGKAEVIVAKHRNGPIGTARLGFDGARTLFYEAEDVQRGMR